MPVTPAVLAQCTARGRTAIKIPRASTPAATERMWMDMRRADAARNGYRGPLNRDEAAVRQLARLDELGYRADRI